MAFLTKDELKTKATIELINLIINRDDGIVETIIEESIAVMESYLFEHFDTAVIFAAEDGDRSNVVLKFLKDIVIHEIYLVRSKQFNEAAKMKYDEAILWLEKIEDGKKKPDLPIKLIDTDGDGQPDGGVPFMKLGSRKTYPNHF